MSSGMIGGSSTGKAEDGMTAAMMSPHPQLMAQAWPRLRISRPTLPAASSRRAIDGRLVAVDLDLRRAAHGDLAGATGRDQRQVEAIGNTFQAVIDGYAGHG